VTRRDGVGYHPGEHVIRRGTQPMRVTRTVNGRPEGRAGGLPIRIIHNFMSEG